VFNEARKMLKEKRLGPCIIDSSTVHKALTHIWGFPCFRDIQEDIIHSFLLGNDTWGVMKTGLSLGMFLRLPI
jgi:superfamily II DNA helicase RecQ